MNIILFSQQDFISANRIKLSGRRYEHMISILKIQQDDLLEVGLLNGKRGKGKVVEIRPDEVVLDVTLTRDPDPKIPLTLILALPRPLVFRRVLSAVTALGVEKIICLQTARVEKGYWNSPAINQENVRQALELGLEQAGDTVPPEVLFEKWFKPFVDDKLPEIIKGKECLLAHPDNALPCPANMTRPCVLAVGPEGGFVDDEVKKFCALGFQPVHLGPRILRVETAVSALIGRIVGL